MEHKPDIALLTPPEWPDIVVEGIPQSDLEVPAQVEEDVDPDTFDYDSDPNMSVRTVKWKGTDRPKYLTNEQLAQPEEVVECAKRNLEEFEQQSRPNDPVHAQVVWFVHKLIERLELYKKPEHAAKSELSVDDIAFEADLLAKSTLEDPRIIRSYNDDARLRRDMINIKQQAIGVIVGGVDALPEAQEVTAEHKIDSDVVVG